MGWMLTANLKPRSNKLNDKIEVLFTVKGKCMKGIYFIEHDTFDQDPPENPLFGNNYDASKVDYWMLVPEVPR